VWVEGIVWISAWVDSPAIRVSFEESSSDLVLVELAVLVLLLALVLERDDDEADEDVDHEERDDDDVDEVEDGHARLVVVDRTCVLVVRVDTPVHQTDQPHTPHTSQFNTPRSVSFKHNLIKPHPDFLMVNMKINAYSTLYIVIHHNGR